MSALTMKVIGNCMDSMADAKDVEWEQAPFNCKCGWYGDTPDTRYEYEPSWGGVENQPSWSVDHCPSCGKDINQ